jgi:hypothetical protein
LEGIYKPIEATTMSTKQTTHLELVEPLQSFLENLTQELTEQKFVPAMRDELKRLLTALESLQQSEDSLQQIARGVERLREVFAPAGTRLLEGVKDLESVMRANADQLRERAGGVLNNLLETHGQIETALRSEAGLLQEQTAASREALARTVAEVESRLTGLSSHVDTLCRKLDQEASALMASAPVSPDSAPRAPQTVAAPGAEAPAELRELIARSERTIVEVLETYRSGITAALKQGRSDDQERLTRLDQRISDALSTVGPRMQEELETAVARLRDQIQTLILAEVETRAVRSAATSEPSALAAPAADIGAALTASETRILREIAALQKSPKSEISGERILKELAQGFEDVARKYASQADEDRQAVQESVTTLQRMMTQSRESEHQIRDELSVANVNLDSLVKSHREFQHGVEENLRGTLSRLDAQSKILDQKTEEDRRLLADLAAAMSRAEQAATTATELALSDSRTHRERIDAALKDLRERIDRGQTSDSERVQDTLRRVAEAWTEALETLRDFIQKTISSRTDAITSRLEGLETRLAESGQTSGNTQRDVQTEIRRLSAMMDERIAALNGMSQASTSGIEGDVKAMSEDVAAVRTKQEQTLTTLRDVIRTNYDENAARLKEIIESAADSFIKQTAIVPQALDRYAHLIQSLHQGDQLALQGIASDTQNVLALSTEKFDMILADNAAMKKFFPLLDKKLEKQVTELEMVRKSQTREDKEFSEIKGTIVLNREWQEEQNKDLKGEIQRTRTASDEGFEGFRSDMAQLKSALRAVTEENLPAVRRELNALLASKFEFIENTLRDRQDALRKEIMDHLSTGRNAHMKTHWILAGAVGLSILLQLVFHFAKTPGAGH